MFGYKNKLENDRKDIYAITDIRPAIYFQPINCDTEYYNTLYSVSYMCFPIYIRPGKTLMMQDASTTPITDSKKDNRINPEDALRFLEENMVVFNHNVEYYRKKSNLTQYELAYMIRTTQPHINFIERDSKLNINLLTAVKIASVLKVSLAELFTPIPTIHYKPKFREKRYV